MQEDAAGNAAPAAPRIRREPWGWERDVEAFESAPDAYLLTDGRAIIRRANHAASELLNTDRAAIVGRSLALFVDPAHRSYLRERVLAMLREPSTATEWELRIQPHDRQPITASIAVNAARDEHGRPLGLRWLVRDITPRKAAEDRLHASLREKDVLLREVFHRVKNNLQVISSLLSLQAASCGVPEAVETLSAARRRVRAMAVVHERLYRSADVTHVDFADFVRHAFHSAGYVKAGVELVVEAQARLEVDQAIPCGMIVNELLSNALKHAFPEGRSGTVHVSLSASDPRNRVLVVSDDGIGLPADPEPPRPGSLGLGLVDIMVAQLGGTVSIASARGTTVRIEFAV